MFYVFKATGECVATCNYEPDKDDLASRNELAVFDEAVYDIGKIQYKDGKIIELVIIKTLDELKQEAITNQYNIYNKEKYGVVWLEDGSGIGFDTDKDSQIDWNSVKEIARLNPEAPIFYRVWVSETEKKFIQITLEQLNMAGTLSQVKQQQAYLNFETVKAEIMAITEDNKEDINKYL